MYFHEGYMMVEVMPESQEQVIGVKISARLRLAEALTLRIRAGTEARPTRKPGREA
jgi:hypothetical protein